MNIHNIVFKAHTVEPTWLLPFLGQPTPVFPWCVWFVLLNKILLDSLCLSAKFFPWRREALKGPIPSDNAWLCKVSWAPNLAKAFFGVWRGQRGESLLLKPQGTLQPNRGRGGLRRIENISPGRSLSLRLWVVAACHCPENHSLLFLLLCVGEVVLEVTRVPESLNFSSLLAGKSKTKTQAHHNKTITKTPPIKPQQQQPYNNNKPPWLLGVWSTSWNFL